MREELEEWLAEVVGDASSREMGTRLDINHATVARHLAEDIPPAPTLIGLARAYDANPVDALIAAGWITTDEVQGAGGGPGMRQASETSLLLELLRRSKKRDADEKKRGRSAKLGRVGGSILQ
jgi:hypothetical protein